MQNYEDRQKEVMKMTDRARRHHLAVMDRSGSMATICEDMENGFHQYIRDRMAGEKNGHDEPFTDTITLWQFDDKHDEVIHVATLDKALEWKLEPRGMTRLYDALGMAITREGERLAKVPENERPGLVIVLVVTDGKNNDSREYTQAQINDMITRQRNDYNWRFVFLGANQDVFEEGAKMGMSTSTSLGYAPTSRGVKMSWGSTSSVVNVASAAAPDNDVVWAYSDKDRAEAMAEDDEE
jgi:hypothetical protein